MSTTKVARLGLVAGTLVLGVGAFSAGAAASGGGSKIERRGDCSSGSEWRLSAQPDGDRIEVEFEVDSDRGGETWSVRITDNGINVFQGRRTTEEGNGSFRVERLVPDLTGVDAFRAVATSAATGERCVGTVRL
jgi:hypothetical protein